MSIECKKRRNGSKVTKKPWARARNRHGTASSDFTTDQADTETIRVDNNGGNDGNLLPSWAPWIVSACMFVIRVYYVTNPANWWVLHPDEVFQSMDVAHSEAYGYGFRPYEFISLPKGDNLSHYQVKETLLEMCALRSPLYPQLLALVARIFSTFDFALADQPFLLWRIFHVFVSSGLPLAASMFVKASGQSSDVAVLSSILIGASTHLNIFGTHTIINSFVSPFIFVSMSWLISLLHRKMECDSSMNLSRQREDHNKQNGDKPVLYDSIDRGESFSHTSKISVGFGKSQHEQNGKLPLDHDSAIFDGFSDNGLFCLKRIRNSTSSDSGFDNNSNSSYTSSTGDHSDEEDGDASDKEVHMENLDHNHKACFRRVSNSNLQNKKMNPSVHKFRRTKCDIPSSDSRGLSLYLYTFSDFGAGFLLGISMYIRPDSCLFVTTVLFANIKFNRGFFCSVIKKKSSWIFLIGAFLSILLGIADDLYFYQDSLISPWQWFKFNVLSSLSSRLFGTSDATFYISNVFFGNSGVAALSVIFMSSIIFHFIIYGMGAFKNDPSPKAFQPMCRKNNALNDKSLFEKVFTFANPSVNTASTARYIYSIILFVLIYTSFGHKEERFMHDILVLHFMIISGLLIGGVQIVKFVFTRRIMLYVLMTSYCLSQWQAMPGNNEAGVNQCLYFVSKQNDVRGLFLDQKFSSTFSYSLIHQHIPLLTSLQNDIQEFDKSSLISSNRGCFVQSNATCRAGFVSMNSVSNVIHSSNAQGLIKYLLQNHQKYNYAIVSSSKDFFPPAYSKVYTSDSYSVWRFTDTKSYQKHLQQITQQMTPDASQHVIEEYEAERLKQLGNYWIALDRFRSAKAHAPSKSKILASMAFCFQRIGMMREAKWAFEECLRKSHKNECARGNEVRVPDAGSGKVV